MDVSGRRLQAGADEVALPDPRVLARFNLGSRLTACTR